jgi:hypothetical protein
MKDSPAMVHLPSSRFHLRSDDHARRYPDICNFFAVAARLVRSVEGVSLDDRVSGVDVEERYETDLG